ncbi:MAG: PD-(D/E)XK nuclease family protein [Chloroflexi bacterium]|nr:PD-(D/E)XK nuclease family protein [Chloroflexota bacterium]
MNLPDDFAFTQGSLQDAADCPRRFELRYIKRLRYPAVEAAPALQFERRTRQGARFHKLVQQHLLGVPAETLARSLHDDPELAAWWQVFRDAGLAGLPVGRQAEITLQAHLAGRRLIAKYDLLALDAGGEAVIVDWKTWRRVPAQSYLQGRLQTILYRTVLAKAGAHLYGGPIPPGKIRMVYCFVARGGERVSIDYSAEQLREDEAYLLNLISEIDETEQFRLTEDEARCRFCTYRSLCERGDAGLVDLLDEEEELEEEDFVLDFDQIAEIEF